MFNLENLCKQEHGIQHKRQQKLLVNLEKRIRDRFGYDSNSKMDVKKDPNSKEEIKTVFTIHSLIDEVRIFHNFYTLICS